MLQQDVIVMWPLVVLRVDNASEFVLFDAIPKTSVICETVFNVETWIKEYNGCVYNKFWVKHLAVLFLKLSQVDEAARVKGFPQGLHLLKYTIHLYGEAKNLFDNGNWLSSV